MDCVSIQSPKKAAHSLVFCGWKKCIHSQAAIEWSILTPYWTLSYSLTSVRIYDISVVIKAMCTIKYSNVRKKYKKQFVFGLFRFLDRPLKPRITELRSESVAVSLKLSMLESRQLRSSAFFDWWTRDLIIGSLVTSGLEWIISLYYYDRFLQLQNLVWILSDRKIMKTSSSY